MFTIFRIPILSPHAAVALAALDGLRVLLHRRRGRMERLTDLSDHMLRDIGLERGAVRPRPVEPRRDED